MEKVSFKIVSAEQDFSALLKYNMFQKRKALPIILGVVSTVSVVSLLGSYLHIFPIPRFLYIMSMIWLVLILIFILTTRKQLKITTKAASGLVGRVMEFEVDESGILERDAETAEDIHLPWEYIHEVDETKDYIFIYVTHNQCFIIPKAQLGKQTTDELKAVLKLYGPAVK
ncbi:MAG: YcxB family protein [Firmicutes bacterium]|nr:YcxB family protein [Bacillota bacterium]